MIRTRKATFVCDGATRELPRARVLFWQLRSGLDELQAPAIEPSKGESSLIDECQSKADAPFLSV